MKNILRLLLITTILFVNQQAKAQVKFGLKGGVGLSDRIIKITGKDKGLIEDEISKTKNILTFHVGALIDLSLAKSLSLQSGLLYSRKGFQIDDSELESDEYDKVFFSYLEAPFHLTYHKDKFQLFAGPYFSYGLSGINKWKYDNELIQDTDSEELKPTTKTISLDDKQSYFNAIDYGLDFGVGYQVGPILLNASYSFGLGNVLPKYEDIKTIYDIDIDVTMNYRAFSLSGTYFFGGE